MLTRLNGDAVPKKRARPSKGAQEIAFTALQKSCFNRVCSKTLLMETGMSLKNIAIGLNVLLMLLCVGFFAGHGLPKSLMLWSSAILWFVAPIVNLLYIRKNS